MITDSTGVDMVIPSHYIDDYPKFVEFMNSYFKFMYRGRGGMNEAEMDALLASKGRELTIEMNNKPSPSAATEEIHEGVFLERGFEGIITKDGATVETSDSRKFEVSVDRTDYINRWYKDMGYSKEVITQIDGQKMTFLDDIRIIKTLKALFEIRGSQHAMELFFSIFFDAKIEIIYPREKIAIIDDNFIPDGVAVPRDDNYYSEFSYVVKIDSKKVIHQDLFVDFYKYYFHPSGFKLFVENVS